MKPALLRYRVLGQVHARHLNRFSSYAFLAMRLYTSPPANPNVEKEVLHVQGEDGNYKLIVPLPSCGQRMFTLPRGPIRTFLDVLKLDDPAIKDVDVYDTNEVRFASSLNTQDLVKNDFKLKINDVHFLVTSPLRTKVFDEIAKNPKFHELDDFFLHKTDDLQTIPYADYLKKALELGLTESEAKQALKAFSRGGSVLYFEDNVELKDTIFLRPKELSSAAETILNIPYLKNNLKEKNELLEQLRSELFLLESRRNKLHSRAEKSVKIFAWSILAVLTAQAILFARLVWWDFDWGIMEPVTWFTSVCEMTIGGYIYYLVTRQEYGNMLTAKMLAERRFRRLCKVHNLDLEKLNNIVYRIRQIEADIASSTKNLAQ